MFNNEEKAKKAKNQPEQPEVGEAKLPGEDQQPEQRAQTKEEFEETLKEAGQDVDEWNKNDFEELTGAYLKPSSLKPGVGTMFKLIEKSTFFDNNKGVEVPAVILADKDGMKYKTAAKVIVDSLSNTENGKMIRLTYLGKVKSPNGQYDNVKVEVAKS